MAARYIASRMAVPLTTLQTLEGVINVGDATAGWRVVTDGGQLTLHEPDTVLAGTYEARGRATTTRPGGGSGMAREVWVIVLDGGDLRAVRITDAEFVSRRG